MSASRLGAGESRSGLKGNLLMTQTHGASMSTTGEHVSSPLDWRLSIHRGSTAEKINGVRVTLKVALMRNLREMLILYPAK